MIRGYIAQSADGFVADKDGGVGFLDAFQGVDYGYDAFLANIGTVVMGRATYDQIVGFDVGWPYPGKRGIVVTSTPLETTLKDAESGAVVPWHQSLEELAEMLGNDTKDSWIVGGPRLQAAFLENCWMNELELFVMPVLLGNGVPLFTSERGAIPLTLTNTRQYENGAVGLSYRLAQDAAN